MLFSRCDFQVASNYDGFRSVCQKVPTDITDLESLGELGHGTMGTVMKMRHKKSKALMAVKVSWEGVHRYGL